jgi:small subunit ribosomal protein S4e
MARGPKRHLKRLAAPKNWMLSKLGGIFATRPTVGPYKLRECLPLTVIIRNRLKFALTARETKVIISRRFIKVDGKVRTDANFAVGFGDVLSIEKAGKMYRVLYNTKGHFVLHKINDVDAKFKLCRVSKYGKASKGIYGRNPLATGSAAAIPYIQTHDGRTIRFADPLFKKGDTVKVDLETGKVVGHLKAEVGNQVMIIRGNNAGRVGVITTFDKHPGSFDIVHVEDASGAKFSTRSENTFVIGTKDATWITLPKDNGVKTDIISQRKAKLAANRK